MKTSWRCPEDVFCLRLQNASSRRIDQNEYIRLTHTSSGDVFKTSSKCLDRDQYNRLVQTSSRRLGKTSSKRFHDALKTSSRSLEDIFKMFCKDVLKTVLVNTFSRCLRDVFKTFLRRISETTIYRRICLGRTSEKFMVSVQNL